MGSEKSLDELKPDLQGGYLYLRKNPQLALSGALFFAGMIAIYKDAASMAGALFGAGAAMLGGWITLDVTRRASESDKKTREENGKRYLTPELKRVIDKLMFIHQRALANYSTRAMDQLPPDDILADFVPYMPVLYPNAPQFHDLSGDDAISLVEFYDSLHDLERLVNDWYDRPEQRLNVFNAILHCVDTSLKYAQTCVLRFELDTKYPPQIHHLGTLSKRIEVAVAQSNRARENHIAHFNAKQQRQQR